MSDRLRKVLTWEVQTIDLSARTIKHGPVEATIKGWGALEDWFHAKGLKLKREVVGDFRLINPPDGYSLNCVDMENHTEPCPACSGEGSVFIERDGKGRELRRRCPEGCPDPDEWFPPLRPSGPSKEALASLTEPLEASSQPPSSPPDDDIPF